MIYLVENISDCIMAITTNALGTCRSWLISCSPFIKMISSRLLPFLLPTAMGESVKHFYIFIFNGPSPSQPILDRNIPCPVVSHLAFVFHLRRAVFRHHASLCFAFIQLFIFSTWCIRFYHPAIPLSFFYIFFKDLSSFYDVILDIIGFWCLRQDYTVIINFTLRVRVTDWLDGILVMVLPF